MNILDLDRLGERINELDRDDELYNCTAQLVITAYQLTAALSAIASSEKGSAEERVAIETAQVYREETLVALKAFEPSPR